MSANDEEADFLEEADVRVRRVLRGFKLRGYRDTEPVRDLARLVLWATAHDLDGENAEMSEALLLMRDGAKMFARAVEETWVAEVKNERVGAE